MTLFSVKTSACRRTMFAANMCEAGMHCNEVTGPRKRTRALASHYNIFAAVWAVASDSPPGPTHLNLSRYALPDAQSSRG